jgi:hypothetical protein
MDDMFVRIWEYSVPSTSVERFARAYGPSGDWARLFRHGAGYAGTELCRSTGRPDDVASLRVRRRAAARLVEAWSDVHGQLDGDQVADVDPLGVADQVLQRHDVPTVLREQ